LGKALPFGLIAVAGLLSLGGQEPPKTIFALYKAGRDTIRVTPGADGKVALALKLHYANGHTCALDKEGEWQGDHLVVVAEGITENEPCKLEASFPSGRIVLKDEGQRCARVYCGTRGKLDAVSVPKTSSVHK
jgi:hypothetical protein